MIALRAVGTARFAPAGLLVPLTIILPSRHPNAIFLGFNHTRVKGPPMPFTVEANVFGKLIDVSVKLLVPLAVVAILLGISKTFIDLWRAWKMPGITDAFDLLVTDVLSMFVVVELLKSIVEYFDVHRLKMTFIIEAAVVFVLREVMVGLYKHSMSAAEMGGMAALLLVIGGLRIAAVIYSPAAQTKSTGVGE